MAEMAGQVPKTVVQERYERLVALQEDISWGENKKQVGRVLEVMVAEGEGRKDGATRRLSGRAPDNRLVHFARPEEPVRPGDMATVEITYAAPHHLLAEAPPRAVRRTRSGDAWAARQAAPDEGGAGGTGVLLGLPTVGVPDPLPHGAGLRGALTAPPGCAGNGPASPTSSPAGAACVLRARRSLPPPGAACRDRRTRRGRRSRGG